MRIIVAAHDLGSNGATIGILDLVRYLTAAGHSVSVVIPPDMVGTNPYIEEQFSQAGAAFLTSFIYRDYDLLIANPIFSHKIILDCTGALPIIGWVHEAWAGVELALSNIDVIRALRCTDRLVFPTGFAADGYRSFLLGYAPNHISIIPYAIREPGDGPAAPKAQGKTRIVFVGSFYPRKRPGDLVKAVLSLNNPSVECVFIGDIFRLEPDIEAAVEQNPHIFTRTGPLPVGDVQALYRSADIFCLPSNDESFGIANFEAASHKIPVVLSDLDCYAGLWAHDRNCLMHQIGNVELLNMLLQALILSPAMRQRLGHEGAKTARLFSHERFSALFGVAIHDTLRQRAGH